VGCKTEVKEEAGELGFVCRDFDLVNGGED
jgi:hypothetical protein